jgi:hypothetical protein
MGTLVLVLRDGTIVRNIPQWLTTNNITLTVKKDVQDKQGNIIGQKTEEVAPDLANWPNKLPWPIIKEVVDWSQKPHQISSVQDEQYTLNIRTPIVSDTWDTSISPKRNIIIDHLEYLSGESFEWVSAWIGQLLVSPDKKPGTALVFRGCQGSGKGLFFDIFMHKLLGEAHLTTSRAVMGKHFNSDTRGKLLINLNEGSWDQSRGDIGSIKQFITDPTFPFEQKGRDRQNLRNDARLVLTTNSEWAIKLDGDDRRFCVITTPKPKDHNYYDQVVEAINDDQMVLNAALWFRQSYLSSTVPLNRPPMTQDKADQITLSSDYIDQVLDYYEEFRDLDDGHIYHQDWSKSDIKPADEIKLTVFCEMYSKITKYSLNPKRLGLILRSRGYEVERKTRGSFLVVPTTKSTKSTKSTKPNSVSDEQSDLIENDVPMVFLLQDGVKTMEDWTKSENLVPYSEETHLPDQDGEFVIKNPLVWDQNGEIHHKNSLLASMKNIVFEWDDLDPIQQDEFVNQYKNQAVGSVFSGNKSTHLWFHIEDDPPTTVEEYHFLVRKLNKEWFQYTACQSCMSPSQPMRRPGVVRKSTGRCQEGKFWGNLLTVPGWREEYEDYKLKQWAELNSVVENTFDSPERVRSIVNKIEISSTNGGRGKKLIGIIHWLATTNLSKSDKEQVILGLCKKGDCMDKYDRIKEMIC